MPPRNKVKVFGEQVYYHAYNRGYNKQEIFRDERDYRTFLHLFRKYLDPEFRERKYTPKGEEYFVEANHVYKEVDLVGYCLMSNHFHLLLYQNTLKGMTKLLSRLTSNYATYFNQKYQTEGSPFQDTYKAVAVKTEEQLIHLSRYIHANPAEVVGDQALEIYPYSSYPAYLSGKIPAWLKPASILNSFEKPGSYKEFVEAYRTLKETKTQDLKELKDLILEGQPSK